MTSLIKEMLNGVFLRRSTVLRPCRNSALVLSSMRRSEGRRWPGLGGMGDRPLLSLRLTGLRTLLRLLARLPARLAPLLTLLLLALRLRFLRLTGEGLADSDELTTLALAFTISLSEPLESDTAGLAFDLASFLGLASLSESLATGRLLFSGLLLSARAGDLIFTASGSFLSLGPASSESESDVGLSGLTFARGSTCLTGLDLSVLSLPLLDLSVSLLSFLLDLPLSSAGFLLEVRSLLTGLARSDRRSLLRLRGDKGEGVRRLRGGLRLLSLLSESRCLNDMGLLARLCGEDLLGLDLERLGGVRFLGEVRRLDLLGERRLRLLVLRLRGLSGLLALFFPLERDLDLELALLLEEPRDLLRLLLLCLPFSLDASAECLP